MTNGHAEGLGQATVSGAKTASTHQPTNDSHALAPWAESNQGLLSLIALFVALAIAVYEVKRAARAEMQAERAYCDWAISAAERSMELSRDAIRTILTNDQSVYRMPLGMWRFLQANAIATLEEILPGKLNNPELTHHVNRLLRTMKMEVKGENGSSEALEELQQHLTYVEIARDHIKRVKPKKSRELVIIYIGIVANKGKLTLSAVAGWRPFRKRHTYAEEWGQPFDLTDRPS